MIAAEDLITLVGNYNPKSNAKLLLQAHQYGMKMHDGAKINNYLFLYIIILLY